MISNSGKPIYVRQLCICMKKACSLQLYTLGSFRRWSDSCSGGGGGGTTGTNPFYPDWDGETCVNDGGQ